MTHPHPAGDFDYEQYGQGYARQRRADPRIAARVHAALGAARSVLNVGAGAGSYEPAGRQVVAVEPSAAMRAQRPPSLGPAIHAIAEYLPLASRSFDAAMALITVHQWAGLEQGLGELRRVARGPVVVMTFEREALARYWLADYVPELVAAEFRRYPPLDVIAAALGGAVTVHPVPIPIDCTDGFGEAYYARPERFLDPEVRRWQSAWGFVTGEVQARFVARLGEDLRSGAWERRYGGWRRQPWFEGSLRLVVSRPAPW
ncbi:MAG: methyltransferase domain-containing protein [Chloroflexi bacterium]|jgi:hypothetical protein|nr:methyltransferase domain-containing protein [Chloroflexota bacterium]